MLNSVRSVFLVGRSGIKFLGEAFDQTAVHAGCGEHAAHVCLASPLVVTDNLAAAVVDYFEAEFAISFVRFIERCMCERTLVLVSINNFFFVYKSDIFS